jgi:hypothetical protein
MVFFISYYTTYKFNQIMWCKANKNDILPVGFDIDALLTLLPV